MIESNGSAARARVLLIGAGRRIQGNFLPVLSLLKDRFEIVGIYSRTFSALKPVADAWQVRALTGLGEIDMNTVDVVAISVPTAQNASVLRSLLPYASRLTIVVDTPIAWTKAELRQCAPLLAQFVKVTVAEDYMNFPTFALVREAVRLGWIGTPTALTLNNTGYLYHGLALIRSFVDFARARRTWTRSSGQSARIVGYRFRGGFGAVVVGPYRRHTTGGLLLEGTSGIITEFEADRDIGGAAKPVSTLKVERVNGRLCGCTLAGPKGSLSADLKDLHLLYEMPFSDKSELNVLRSYGLASVFRSLFEDDSLNNRYGFENAFYDGFISRLAGRGQLPVDPFTWFGASAMSVVHLRSRLFR